MLECFDCGFYESDFECCSCPSHKMWYACPIESQTVDGKNEIDAIIKFLQDNDCKN